MADREKAFMEAFNKEIEAANRKPEGADHIEIRNRLAQEWGLAPRYAADLIQNDTLDKLRG